MSENREGLSRRGFVKASVVSAGLVASGALLSTGAVVAEELPHVEESDPTAKALQYVHDASQADPAARGGDDRNCATCQFYTGADGSEWGPCTLFPGKAVNAQGWCSAWAQKAG